MRELLVFLHNNDLLIPAVIIASVLFAAFIHAWILWKHLLTPVIDLPKDLLKPWKKKK
jgi:hypothetical protein